MGVTRPVPSTRFFLSVSRPTILRREGTCVAVDAPGEVPTAMDAVLVEVSPRRTCSRSVTVYAVQCSSLSSTSRRV